MSGGNSSPLVRALRGAERGSRDLNAMIYEALGYEVKRDHARMGYAYRGFGPLLHGNCDRWQSLGDLTGSINQAERLLPPGMRYGLFSNGQGKGPSAMVMRGDEPVQASGFAKTTALALAAACMEARERYE